MTTQATIPKFEIPTFEVQPTDIGMLPTIVEGFFVKMAQMYMKKEPVRGIENFDQLLVLRSSASSCITYVGEERKTFDNNDADESLLHIIELNEQQAKVGYGQVRLVHTKDPSLKNTPFVGMTRTEKGFLRQGFGTRRLLVMNHLAQLTFGKPLHSSGLIKPEAERRWQYLEQNGVVEAFNGKARSGYRFKSAASLLMLAS